MIIGHSLVSNSNNPGVTYYSPWFSKLGNSATFVCDIIQFADIAALEITVETKKLEESDDGASAVGSAASITLTANVRTSFERGGGLAAAGFEELVRFKYVVKQAASPSYLGFIHFRMLNPSWLVD